MHEVAYSPVNSSAIPLLVVYPIVIVWLGVLMYKLFKKYRKNPRKIILYLITAFLFHLVAVSWLLVGLIESFWTGYHMFIYRISLPLASMFAVLGTYYFMQFAKEGSWTYSRSKDWLLRLGALFLSLWLLYDPMVADILHIADPFNWWGRDRPPGTRNLRDVTQGLILLYSLVVYLDIMLHTRKLSVLADSDQARYKLNALSRAAFAMIMFYVFLTVDAVYIAITDVGYSIFLYLGWLSVFYGTYNFYKGLT